MSGIPEREGVKNMSGAHCCSCFTEYTFVYEYRGAGPKGVLERRRKEKTSRTSFSFSCVQSPVSRIRLRNLSSPFTFPPELCIVDEGT